MEANIVEKLEFNSDLKNINIVEKLIDEITDKYGIKSELYGKLLVAVIESVNNAIIHGNKMDNEKKVELEYTVEENEIIFTITDQGKGFDFNNVPDPTKPENLEKTHGRGIFLMSHLADEIEFEDEGSKVLLKFFRAN